MAYVSQAYHVYRCVLRLPLMHGVHEQEMTEEIMSVCDRLSDCEMEMSCASDNWALQGCST